ncbi:hypothetical protein KC323_g166 [Hortaea werneckii]|nr:hypothetical protein KC323_g166 [Hortaea werneckii]
MVSRYINWPCSIERVECLESLIETLCNVLYEVGGGIKEATKTIKKTTLFVKVEMLDLMARESQRSPSIADSRVMSYTMPESDGPSTRVWVRQAVPCDPCVPSLLG